MKFSFLIPSKNRLELLPHSVDSILRQGYDDLEIIISDNASEQDYAAYVQKIADPRIVYRKLPVQVPVTENWNNALELARGDYVLMLGDDDALAPGFLPQMARVVRDMGHPDIVYLAAYHYCYPGVMSWEPAGYLADVRNSEFLGEKSAPFALSAETARRVATAAFDFRYLFGFNSQHFLFRSGFLKEIAADVGSIFQSPYPDTFAATVSFLKAKSIAVMPQPLVMIGISPKSFGYYYFNDLIKEGSDFLGNEALSPEVREAVKDSVLPGDRNNTNWLVAVEAARRALAPEFDIKVGVERYRMLQMVAFLREIYLKHVRQPDELASLLERLTPSESAALSVMKAVVESAGAPDLLIRAFEAFDRGLGQFWPAAVKKLDIGAHSSIRDAFDWLERSREIPAAATASASTVGTPAETACPYCSGAAAHTFSAADWNQKTSHRSFDYSACRVCKLIFVDRLPTDLADYYVNEQYDIPADASGFQARADSQLWKVDLLKRLVSKGSLLEIGPATGEFAYAARQAGFNPSVMEMDERCCNFLRNALGLDVLQTDDPAASFVPGRRYDAICIWQAIEHIPEFWKLLKAGADALSPDGVMILSTPNPRSLQARVLGRHWPHIDAPRHLYLIPQDWFTSFAARQNLSIVMNTTRDVGSVGLNYYGWYLAVRNLSRGMLSERRVQSIASHVTRLFRRAERAEGRGCSYTIAFRRNPA